ncbi:sugar transferase [Mangrovimonas aestuarii]|uniref:sugar transferase n=1 Tax=Mangrovimonas aestuarii TaxID=3018443 RepID=UPI0023799461|nr:sugar transferase [Mangrovimonas aestuarii]
MKRILDIVIPLVILIVISPLLLIIILLLKFTGEGEVFYLQERMGKDNNPFYIYKFATMLKNSPNMGGKTITVRNDPRITPIGKWLRISKFNELPQLFNVVKGDMSLVGPRPLLKTSFLKYTPDVQNIIYKNTPGVTGIGSLVFRDEEKLVSMYKDLGKDPMDYYRQHIYPYKGQLETWYYKNNSILVDLKIIMLTTWSLINSDSDLVFKIFKDLPPKPYELTVSGIEQIAS